MRREREYQEEASEQRILGRDPFPKKLISPGDLSSETVLNISLGHLWLHEIEVVTNRKLPSDVELDLQIQTENASVPKRNNLWTESENHDYTKLSLSKYKKVNLRHLKYSNIYLYAVIETYIRRIARPFFKEIDFKKKDDISYTNQISTR